MNWAVMTFEHFWKWSQWRKLRECHKEAKREKATNLAEFFFQVIYKFLLSRSLANQNGHLLLQVTNYMGMDLCCSCTFHEFIDLWRPNSGIRLMNDKQLVDSIPFNIWFNKKTKWYEKKQNQKGLWL